MIWNFFFAGIVIEQAEHAKKLGTFDYFIRWL